jgi:cytoskeletal protein RodZ
VIRFSAFLVVVAVGLLVAGVVTSKLMLVYIAIGVSGVALLALGVGAAVNWRELTGKSGAARPETTEPETAQPPTAQPTTAEPETAEPSVQRPAPAPPEPVPASASASAIPSGPSRAGYLPAAEPPPRARPPAAPAPASPRRETPAPGAWEWRDDSIPASPAAASEPEPDSGADPAADSELTLVTDKPDQPAGEAAPAGPNPGMEVTVVPGVPRYHNASCILIRFMGDSDLDKTTLAAARGAGCTPCRACLPDQPEKSPE